MIKFLSHFVCWWNSDSIDLSLFAPVRLLQLNSYDTFKSPDSKPRHLGSVISLIDLFVFVHPFFPYFPLFTNCTASALPWRWCWALLCSVVLASHTDFAWKAVSWVMLIEFGTVRGNKLRCSYWPLKCSRISWEIKRWIFYPWALKNNINLKTVRETYLF